MALQMLYQSDLGGATVPQILHSYEPLELLDRSRKRSPGETEAERTRLREAFEYARDLVEGTTRHLEKIDELIRKQAEHWRLERMSAVDRNILRLAVYELLYEEDVPKLVVLDEAIELAKRYGSEQSGRFVNGLLDGLLKSQDFPGSLT
jgi:N utilization substance protein B